VSDLAALVIGPGPERLRDRVAGSAVEVHAVPSLAELREAAAGARAPRLWLLDAGASPLEGALEALLAQPDDPAVSLPVDDRGTPVEPVLGRFTEGDLPGILAAVSSRRVPLRHTHVVSILIGRETVLEHAPPDPGRFGLYAGTEWTARVFAGRPGMLVPASRVRVAAPVGGSLVAAMRMARTGVWRRGETVRELQRSVVPSR
jgi:hypothetical protein